jgi:integrase/recombinase XerD
LNNSNFTFPKHLLTDIESIDGFFEMLIAEKGCSKSTISSYITDLKHFANFITKKKKTSLKVDEDDIVEYTRILRNIYSINSYNRKIVVIRQYYKFLLSEKLLNKNPTKNITTAKKVKLLPKILEVEEIEQLINVSKNFTTSNYENIRANLIINLLFKSGIRVSELIYIKNDDIKKHQTFLYLSILGKGNKERIVPISEDTKILIDQYVEIKNSKFPKLKETANSYLFISQNLNKNLTRQRVGQILKQLALKAGISPEKVSPHKLRHSFATFLLRNGMNLKYIQDLLGHKDISTTEIYTHLNVSNLEETIKNFHPLNKA